MMFSSSVAPFFSLCKLSNFCNTLFHFSKKFCPLCLPSFRHHFCLCLRVCVNIFCLWPAFLFYSLPVFLSISLFISLCLSLTSLSVMNSWSGSDALFSVFPEAEFMNVHFFLGILFRVLRLEVSVYNVYITNQFQTTFARGGGGGGGVKSVTGDCE
jgi:hypothetical protein